MVRHDRFSIHGLASISVGDPRNTRQKDSISSLYSLIYYVFLTAGNDADYMLQRFLAHFYSSYTLRNFPFVMVSCIVHSGPGILGGSAVR